MAAPSSNETEINLRGKLFRDGPLEQNLIWNCGEVAAAGESHVGMVRENNQDSIAIEKKLGIYLVADGMGGRAGGEIASRLAVSSIIEEISEKLTSLYDGDIAFKKTTLAQTVNAASLRIYERSLELPQFRGMGTTTTLLWLPAGQNNDAKYGNYGLVAHVGDSRCYLLRAGLLYQITEDHSLVNEQIKAGVLKKNDPLASQIRNVITRCVGYQEEEEVDTFAFELLKGDKFLLCSDGLTNKVRDIEIAQALSALTPELAPTHLIAMANERGGEDNISVVVAYLN